MIADVDWPKDLNEGPNGILAASIAMNLKTVGDLVTLADKSLKRERFRRALGDDTDGRVARWNAVQDVVRIAMNNARKVDAMRPIDAPVSSPTGTPDVDQTNDPGAEQASAPAIDEATAGFKSSAPVMPVDPDERLRERRTRTRKDLALEMTRDGYRVNQIALKLDMNPTSISGWKGTDPVFRSLCEQAQAAFRAYGARPGYNGRPDVPAGPSAFDQPTPGEGDGEVDPTAAPGMTQEAVQGAYSEFAHGDRDTIEDPSVERLDDVIDDALAHWEPGQPAVVVRTAEATAGTPIHPRMARELLRLLETGNYGATLADVLVVLAGREIERLSK